MVRKRKTSEKPTTIFGWLRFGKDGSVYPDFDRLGSQKETQEQEAVDRFLAKLEDDTLRSKRLPENDNDFQVIRSGAGIHATVELVEITMRDLSITLTDDQFHLGKHPNGVHTSGEHGEHLLILEEREQSVIAHKIRKKVEKRYAKPKVGEFWLLLWTVMEYPVTGSGS